MDRRLFLAGAGGALATLPLATGASAGGDGNSTLKLLRSYVANRDQFPNSPTPQVGQHLELVRRPDRAFDPLSIAVTTSAGDQLGYLPSASTGMLAALLDGGFKAYGMEGEDGAEGNIIVDIFLNQGSRAA
jgi:hypothetical protein